MGGGGCRLTGASIVEIIVGALIAIAARNTWATWRVFADDLSSLAQRSSGSYPSEPGEIDDYTAEAGRRVQEATSGSPDHVDP